eukprot:m.211219 g.211219  ORF g.211219 m.211219 type:complete len:108 (+) comp17998_c0_seq1:308-631(+)
MERANTAMDKTKGDSEQSAAGKTIGFKTPKSSSQEVDIGRHAGVNELGDAQGPGDAGRFGSAEEAARAEREGDKDKAHDPTLMAEREKQLKDKAKDHPGYDIPQQST